jgi:hypothetical protein
MSVCIQCQREPAHGQVLLTRQRPQMRGESTYDLCLECARRIRAEQDERAQEAIREAERAGA